MSGIDPNARRAVNNALINSGSAAVGQMVATANISVEKRRKNKEEREKRDTKKKVSTKKADTAVRPLLPTPKHPRG